MDIKFSDIQERVYELGGRINASKSLLVLRGQPADDGAPYVVIKDGSLSYISSERGYELFRKEVSSLDELLYLILDRVVSRMAMSHELENRVEGQDSRRIYFSKKIYLMSELDPRWGCRATQEIDEILRLAPYLDQ